MYNESDLIDEFNDFLDEHYDEYEIMGVTIFPREILKTDQIAYRTAFLDWCDANDYEF